VLLLPYEVVEDMPARTAERVWDDGEVTLTVDGREHTLDVETAGCERPQQALAQAVVVVDDEQLRGGAHAQLDTAARRGRDSVASVPWPSAERSRRLPPSRSAIRRTK